MSEVEVRCVWERYELNGARIATVMTYLATTSKPVLIQRHWRQEEDARPSITCPKCGMTSYHPEDVRYGYCGKCEAYTSSETGL